ncbi:hypothetical protein [Paenibacillus sp. Soil724D2]|uniref:hypothetical protein n=1 Tax=Paenibacillus sp. (strain Soil724D2) TaxID=1736392 RepID=UPI0012E346A0|nr:hypothetical protein [Paenibacillus sp. Soil724D2]
MKGAAAICKICTKKLGTRFRTACRGEIQGGKAGITTIHPVHLHCIEDHGNAEKILMSDSGYYDFSPLDMVAMIDIFVHLKTLEESGRLPDIQDYEEEKRKHTPSPQTPGEPFYTLAEIKDGVPTDKINSHPVNGKLMMILYVTRKVADQAKALSKSEGWENFQVSGVNKLALNQIISSDTEVLVVMGFEGTSAISMQFSGSEIAEELKPGGRISSIIKRQQ